MRLLGIITECGARAEDLCIFPKVSVNIYETKSIQGSVAIRAGFFSRVQCSQSVFQKYLIKLRLSTYCIERGSNVLEIPSCFETGVFLRSNAFLYNERYDASRF